MENLPIVGQPFMNPPDDTMGDVMVVGGGISGIQAALDLATAGYKVYLVEKTPTIGGKMAQLDKTFPTNDCSMCIESPKFIECDRHPNIEILTYTEVDKVEGEAGDFKVTLTKKPRYIIEDKCTGCTLCARQCPQNCIEGEKKKPHIIRQADCIQCGLCYDSCKFNAIRVE